jgi:hypothetical protein
MSKRKKILIIVGIVALIFLVGQNVLERTLGSRNVLGTHSLNDDGQRKFSAENFRGESENISSKISILEIDGKRYEEEITEKTSVYDFMSRLRNEGKINFTEKNYIGMGKFIESINGIKGNGKQNWIYYVNNKKAEIGVSNYEINGGDIVSWKYEKNY